MWWILKFWTLSKHLIFRVEPKPQLAVTFEIRLLDGLLSKRTKNSHTSQSGNLIWEEWFFMITHGFQWLLMTLYDYLRDLIYDFSWFLIIIFSWFFMTSQDFSGMISFVFWSEKHMRNHIWETLTFFRKRIVEYDT